MLRPGSTISIQGTIRLWGGAARGCPASPHTGEVCGPQPSESVRCRAHPHPPFLKGPGLAGRGWLDRCPGSLPPPFRVTSSYTDPLQSPTLETFSKIPKQEPPPDPLPIPRHHCWACPTPEEDGNNRITATSGPGTYEHLLQAKGFNPQHT